MEVSGQLIGPTFNSQGIQEDLTDLLSRNVSWRPLLYVAQSPKGAQMSSTPRQKPENVQTAIIHGHYKITVFFIMLAQIILPFVGIEFINTYISFT
jgi:hypothetical protein